MSKIPGITAMHRIVTDNCRTRGKDIALEEALNSLREEFKELEKEWPADENHRFHFVLTVDNAHRRNK